MRTSTLTTLHPGDVVMVRCDVVMANDVSGPVAFARWSRMGAARVFDPAKVVMVADHFTPAKDAALGRCSTKHIRSGPTHRG